AARTSCRTWRPADSPYRSLSRPSRDEFRTPGRRRRRWGSRAGTGDMSSPGGLASALVARTPVVNPHGQREGERGPLADVALDPDPPALQLDELLGQGQAEPRPLLLPGVVPADLAELLEDGRLVPGRDPDARVADGNRDDALGRRGGEADPAALRGELHGI